MIQRLTRKIRNTTKSYFFGTGMHLAALKLASRSNLLASLWVVLSGAFAREHRAVIAGRYRHLLEFQNSSSSGLIYTLRRNTHRLEKGLVMRPRRAVFALDYIGETVRMYVALAKDAELRAQNSKLAQWSADVLSEYFSVVGEHEKIEHARELFASVDSQSNEGDNKKIPYARNLSDTQEITIGQLERLAILEAKLPLV